MTREEAQDDVYSYVHDDSLDSIKDFVDKVYDDFESRVCENCRFWRYECVLCGITLHNTRADFGCNKFERRQR